MKKKVTTAFGKNVYLLGKDKDEVFYWLEEAEWDCDWYWGGGYIETYTNNKNPQQSKDINSHSHFDCMFFNSNKNGFDAFKDFFIETPFSDKEIWRICELMKSFYIARRYADMLHIGGANYTANPAKETITNKSEWERINKIVIPEILKHLYETLSKEVAELNK